MKPISDLCHNIFYEDDPDGDLCHIYTGQYKFSIYKSGLEHLKYGLNAHYNQNEYLLSCSQDELRELGKIKPKRTSLDEVNYQIGRKGYDSQVILANDLVSRLPVFSQSRNRNGKQHIADKRWRDALKNSNVNALWLKNYYKYEEDYIKMHFPDVKWTKGSFAISPCHIYPALKDRKEDSWSPDKICRDLSIINKAFSKISSSSLQGKHAINKQEAHIALDYLEEFDFNDLSVTRQILYIVLEHRISNGFYNIDRFTDNALGL